MFCDTSTTHYSSKMRRVYDELLALSGIYGEHKLMRVGKSGSEQGKLCVLLAGDCVFGGGLRPSTREQSS